MNDKDSFDICTKIVQELNTNAPKLHKKGTSDFDLVRNWQTSFRNYIHIKHLTERNLNTIEYNLTKYDNETTNEEM